VRQSIKNIVQTEENETSRASHAGVSAKISEGMKYLVLNGQLLIDKGQMDLTIFPAKPVKR